MIEHRKSRPSINSRTFLGIIISVGLGILPIFLNQNYSLALVVALVGIAASFLLDFALKFKENEEKLSADLINLQHSMEILVRKEGDEIKEIVELGENLSRDQELRETIIQIVEVCEEVKKLNVDVFTRKVDEYLKGCYRLINNLADGEEELKSEFSFLPAEGSTTPSVARIVLCTEPTYLKEGIYARRMLEAMKESIRRNRSITVVWLQDAAVLTNQKYRQIMQDQEKAGIQVLVAEKEQVPLRLHNDYGVIDNKYFYIPSFADGKPDKDNVSNNQEKLRELTNNFNQLAGTLSEKASDYYKLQVPGSAS